MPRQYPGRYAVLLLELAPPILSRYLCSPMKLTPFYFGLLLMMLSGFNLRGQEGFELGGFLGASHYFGDLNTNFRLNQPGLAGMALGRYNFDDRLSIRFSGTYSRVAGNDAYSKNAWEKQRNLSFRSRILEGTAALELNFLPYIHGSRTENFTPYVVGGMSIFAYEPEALYKGTWYKLRELGTEGQFKGEEYNGTSGAWFYGFGFKFDLTAEWSLNIELANRVTWTDYLDDVSAKYPDLEDLEALRGMTAVALSDRSIEITPDQATGQRGRKRGNENDKDHFAVLSIGLVYYFGDLKCPPFLRFPK